jgi:beta-xylosidase
MKVFKIVSIYFFAVCLHVYGQSVSFETYINPVIPGDHPDPTLTRIGNDFYTSGSSFNPTPKIYHSTDLVHWEVISQPVSASWSQYGDSPGGGIWGGHLVLYDGIYWHFFGRGGGSMYFVTADKPEGPWSNPTTVRTPSGVPGLGVDNSIFIDEDTGKWYMLTKAGPQNNHIVELGDDGQPAGEVLDLTWLNPDSEGNPYGWAEGPVMWKYNGYYFYSFAQHLAGSQYVMRSDTLTDEKSDWTIISTNIFTGTALTYRTPNHISPAVQLDDGTSWVIAHSYNSNWLAHGRQGLLCQVTYTDQGFPRIQRPSDAAVTAPDLPSSGIPWAVPHSDFFESDILNPEWSFLGYTPESTYSLSERPGWLRLSTGGRSGTNTVIKNDGEHSYSLITKIDFEPESVSDEAGLWIINGPESHQVKVFSTLNNEDKNVLAFSFEDTRYEVENTIGSVVWLKLIRDEHKMSGFYSADGFVWTQIGETINAADIDVEQAQFNNFTGNQQGLYVRNKEAYFDLYIYRDAYTPIMAANPANQYGTTVSINRYPPNSLKSINNNDWALYAGVEFGNPEYNKSCDSVRISASSDGNGGVIEMYIDSISTGTKIADIIFGDTGSWNDYITFTASINKPISGNHDVYLKFIGNDAAELFRVGTIEFITNSVATSIDYRQGNNIPRKFLLEQNYPNPFNPSTIINYSVPGEGYLSLVVYNLLGQEVETIYDGIQRAGNYNVTFDGSELSSGVYLYQMKADNFLESKKFVLVK